MELIDDKTLKTLLRRFMSGETTLSEEQALGHYLLTHDVEPELQAFKTMFEYFANGMTSLPDSGTRPHHRAGAFPKFSHGIAAAIVAMALLFPVFTKREAPLNRIIVEQQHAPSPATALEPAVEQDANRHGNKAGSAKRKAEHGANGNLHASKINKELPKKSHTAAAHASNQATSTDGYEELTQQELLADEILLMQQQEQLRRETAALSITHSIERDIDQRCLANPAAQQAAIPVVFK